MSNYLFFGRGGGQKKNLISKGRGGVCPNCNMFIFFLFILHFPLTFLLLLKEYLCNMKLQCYVSAGDSGGINIYQQHVRMKTNIN